MNTNPSHLAPNALLHQQLLDEILDRYFSEKFPEDPSSIDQITELDGSCLPISDVSSFRVFTSLRKLDLSLSEVEDLSPLAELPHLEELHLTFHRGVKLDGLELLKGLKILDLSYPRHQIPDLSRISDLENLEELFMNGCGLTTIAHMVPLENLKVLTVSFNRIPAQERAAFRELNPDCAMLD